MLVGSLTLPSQVRTHCKTFDQFTRPGERSCGVHPGSVFLATILERTITQEVSNDSGYLAGAITRLRDDPAKTELLYTPAIVELIVAIGYHEVRNGSLDNLRRRADATVVYEQSSARQDPAERKVPECFNVRRQVRRQLLGEV